MDLSLFESFLTLSFFQGLASHRYSVFSVDCGPFMVRFNTTLKYVPL